MSAVELEGAARDYAWGSTTSIQRLLGDERDGRPLAELWFGAHADNPSAVPIAGTTLDHLIASDPVGVLGAASVARYGERLPFLLKLLAAEHALSIQVHPTLAQARAGFAAEQAAGVAPGAPNRTYRDANHKPELLCALTPFDALCGFRTVPVIRDVLAALALPSLEFLTLALDGADPLREAFTAVLAHPDIAPVSREVGERAAGRGEMLHGVALAAQDFPGDPGVVLALLLNYVRLEPGEAIYLGAGNVHAYLRGTGVEIMANSDNVLRCGLTPKHVDTAELLVVAQFDPLADPRCPSVGGAFDTPAPDFRLATFALAAGEVMTVDDPGACVVLCTDGGLDVGGVRLAPAHAAFVPAGERVTVAGAPAGTAFVAAVGTVGTGGTGGTGGAL